MDLATFNKESARNRAAYEVGRDEIKRIHRGKYLALANGQILGAAETFDAARALVQKLSPVPEYYLVFPADQEPDFELAYDLW